MEETIGLMVKQHGYAAVQKALREVAAALPPMEVAVNRCFGGFNLSSKGRSWLEERGLEFGYDTDRHDPLLIQCIKELGVDANGSSSSLKIEQVPQGADYWIEDYDGCETVHW